MRASITTAAALVHRRERIRISGGHPVPCPKERQKPDGHTSESRSLSVAAHLLSPLVSREQALLRACFHESMAPCIENHTDGRAERFRRDRIGTPPGPSVNGGPAFQGVVC